MREFVVAFFLYLVPLCSTLFHTQLDSFNTLNTRDSVVAEQRRCLYLAAAGLLHLEEEEKRQHEHQEGLVICLAGRHEFGHYDQLLTELHEEDHRGYKSYLRITPDLFQEMMEKLTPRIKKQTTFMREPLEVGLKLAATLRFLATGNSYHSHTVQLQS